MDQTAMIEYRNVNADVLHIFVEGCKVGSVVRMGNGGVSVVIDDPNHIPDVSLDAAVLELMNK